MYVNHFININVQTEILHYNSLLPPIVKTKIILWKTPCAGENHMTENPNEENSQHPFG